MAAPGTPSRRPPAWQLVLAAAAVVLVIAGVVAILFVGDDGDAAVAAGGSSTTTDTQPATVPATQAETTTTIEFAAPPPQSLSTTTTVPPSTSTSSSSTTTTSAVLPSSTTSTTTTTPPPPPMDARPGPVVETTSGDHAAFEAALAAARTRWETSGPDGAYRFRTRTVCFCPVQDNEISVGEDGTVVDQRTVDGDPESAPPTIDEIFDELEALVDQDPDRIRASFDVDFGYPVDFFVDEDERLADEERGRQIDWLAFRTG